MKVLIAEDDAVNRLLLQRFLEKWGYEVALAKDGLEAWRALQEEKSPRLAILDWMMPGMDGVQICREVRKLPNHSYLYLILLTAKFQKQDIIAGLEAGADDYVTKPFDSSELKARLQAGERILRLEEDLRRAHDSLRFQATHDSMTGLWNRAAALEILKAELARAQREKISVGVIMVDLDHFKEINDTYGHFTGDLVLEETARRFRSAMRAYDAIGRYGGEEFLIIVPGCDLACALNQGERLRRAIEQTPVATPEGLIPISISVGVTVSGDALSCEPESLLRASDAALYQAKQRGRNRVESLMPHPLSLTSGLPTTA